MEGLASNLSPLYFMVRNIKEVMSTEQPCDFAYEFGDGLSDIHEYPQGFPRPGKVETCYACPMCLLFVMMISCFNFSYLRVPFGEPS